MRAIPLSPWAKILLLLVHGSTLGLIGAAISNENAGDMLKLNITQQQMSGGMPLNLRLHTQNVTMDTNSDSSSVNIDLTNSLRLKDMLNVFDVNYLASKWITVRSDYSANCSKDIYKYLQGLQNAHMWAMKSE